MSHPHVLFAFALSVIGLMAAGCENHPTAPAAPERPAAAPPAPSPSPLSVPYVDPGFPPAPAGAAVYGRTSPSSTPGVQRYVLHENGRFGLQYVRPDQGFFEFAGNYSRTEAGAHLVFDANGGRWRADATFDGDLLVARYNLEASLDDFEDGVYERQPPGR